MENLTWGRLLELLCAGEGKQYIEYLRNLSNGLDIEERCWDCTRDAFVRIVK